jgi:dihydrofolate reductase
MRTLRVSAFVTLDGVMQAPGGPDEDPTGGFDHGGWTVPFWDDDIAAHLGASMGIECDYLLGRGTYDIFAAHWPHAGADDPFAVKINAARKYVVSTTLTDPTWANTTVISADVPARLAALKASAGPQLEVIGSPGLIQTLLSEDLVDEFALLVYPVVLGTGKRLFGVGTRAGQLALEESKRTAAGVVAVTYRRAGDVQAGSFAFDQPTADEIARREQLSA